MSDPGQSPEGVEVGVGERGADRARPDHSLDLGRRPVCDDATGSHHDDAVGVEVSLLEVVRCEQHGAALGRDRPHRRPERVTRLDVERHRRLVEHQELRVAHEREREAGALRLTAGQLLGAPLGERHRSGELECLVDRERIGVQRGHHRDELADREAPQEAAGLQHRADRPFVDRLRRRAPEQRDGAGVGWEQPEQHVDQGRLARAVRAEEGERLALRDVEIDAADRSYLPRRRRERLDEALEPNACGGRRLGVRDDLCLHACIVTAHRRPR